MIQLNLTQAECDHLELLVLAKMQQLDRINQVKTADYQGLDALWVKLRTPRPLSETEIQELHDKCY